jgi:hypothetical protein
MSVRRRAAAFSPADERRFQELRAELRAILTSYIVFAVPTSSQMMFED